MRAPLAGEAAADLDILEGDALVAAGQIDLLAHHHERKAIAADKGVDEPRQAVVILGPGQADLGGVDIGHLGRVPSRRKLTGNLLTAFANNIFSEEEITDQLLLNDLVPINLTSPQ